MLNGNALSFSVNVISVIDSSTHIAVFLVSAKDVLMALWVISEIWGVIVKE
jgi:hypothetical protein